MFEVSLYIRTFVGKFFRDTYVIKTRRRSCYVPNGIFVDVKILVFRVLNPYYVRTFEWLGVKEHYLL